MVKLYIFSWLSFLIQVIFKCDPKFLKVPTHHTIWHIWFIYKFLKQNLLKITILTNLNYCYYYIIIIKF